MTTLPTTRPGSTFTTVYGPVTSWRYGRSLGIDLIGQTSTCSFNCVYCQLGEIQTVTTKRQIFQPTEQIIAELEQVPDWNAVDMVTLSGSGEPTLALNLEEVIQVARLISHKPVAVLTNGTLLTDVSVRLALQTATHIAVKLDAISADQLQRVNRPAPALALEHIQRGIAQLRSGYAGQLAVQTMVLAPWLTAQLNEYVQRMIELQPDEIQLNTPRRPRSLQRQLEMRGNHPADGSPMPAHTQALRCVSPLTVQAIASQISQATKIPVRYAH
jgi:wyosine [tRNA(Phe)-imidazoG37] synthetase (radical SAM superfamily)